MSKRSTAIATQESAGALAAEKPQITLSEATTRVRKLAAQRLREAKSAAEEQLRNVESAIGGHTKRVDDTVVDQAKALMTRLALIVNRQERSYAGNDGTAEIKKCISKLGEVVGMLQTVMLTSKAIGLFEKIDETDYTGYDYENGKNPLSHAGKKIKDEARELLEGFTIIADPPKNRGKSGQPDGPVVVDVETLVDAAENDEDLDDLDGVEDDD